MKSIVTLTPEESKRLIAKAVIQMEVVREAKKNGIIGLARCSSCAYILEELIGRKLDNLLKYGSGFISGQGSVTLLLEGEEKDVEAAWEMVNSIKGEPPLSELPWQCDMCYIKNDPERKSRCLGRTPEAQKALRR